MPVVVPATTTFTYSAYQQSIKDEKAVTLTHMPEVLALLYAMTNYVKQVQPIHPS